MFIPRYWSFDNKRDILWRAVTDLQKAHAPERQRTDKLELQAHKLECQKNAIRLKREAEAKGLQGREKHEYMCQGLSLSKQTDERTPRRWAEEAEKLGL
ncbi:MAG: hypothetical protein JWM68_399 [Verrucomicrobiales bacterium]|nr:hypothetical protein [Verrucomicrobiales bacterium]